MSRARIASLVAKVEALRRRALGSFVAFLERQDGEPREAWDRRVADAERAVAAAKAAGRPAGTFALDFMEDR
jgi:hypothetical protein